MTDLLIPTWLAIGLYFALPHGDRMVDADPRALNCLVALAWVLILAAVWPALLMRRGLS